MLSVIYQKLNRISGLGTKAASSDEDVAQSGGLLGMGLYTTSIIIGAGVLSLSLVSASIGALPLFFLIVGIGLYMKSMYSRLADSLYAAVDHLKPVGPGLFSQALQKAELGRAGQFALMWSFMLYVIPADIGYIIIGSRTLNDIAALAYRTATFSPAFFIGLAIVLFLLGWSERLFLPVQILRGTCKKIYFMAGVWLTSVAVLLLLMQLGVITPGEPSEKWGNALGLLLFFVAVVMSMRVQLKTALPATDQKNLEMTDDHRVNVFMVRINISLIVVTSLFILLLASIWGFADFSRLLTVGQDFELDKLATAVGVVVFAFVGTGIFNLCQYKGLFSEGKQRVPRIRRVVAIGSIIPIGVYLLWSGISVIVLSPTHLSALDQAKQYTTIGISQQFSQISPLAAWLVMLSGYSVALLAVTSACNGFTESLADQVSIQLQSRSRVATLLGEHNNFLMRVLILVAALCLALIVEQVVTIDLSGILSISGNAGGGLLLLILPYFLPARGQKKATWEAISKAFTTAIVLALLILSAAHFSKAQTAGNIILSVLTLAIALSIFVVTYWLARSEPKAPDEDDNRTIGVLSPTNPINQ